MSDGGLRKLFQSHFPEAHWVPVETWSTGQGVPDSEFCFPGGIAGWIEFKLTSGFAVETGRQVAWLERRARAGGRCFIGVRRQAAAGPRKGPAVDELWLFPGTAARMLSVGGLHAATPPLLVQTAGPRHWNWDRIRSVITAT